MLETIKKTPRTAEEVSAMVDILHRRRKENGGEGGVLKFVHNGAKGATRVSTRVDNGEGI